MRRMSHVRNQKGQSLLELIFMLPIYVILLMLVFQLTVMFFNVFNDFSEVRNTALKGAAKAESTSPACFQERGNYNIKIGLVGGNQVYQTNVQLWGYGNGPSSCS